MTLVADFNSSVNVPFQRMRQMLFDGAMQEGVVGANDLKVVQRGAGANQSVDVGTGFAWVQLDTGTRNGMGHVTNDATANVVVTASNATNPRVDQIVLRWNDSSIPTGSGNVPTLEVVTGTPTAAAQIITNGGAGYRAGAAALPNDCLRLADILVPATSTSVTTANIVDRRPWARGFYNRLTLTTGTLTATAGAGMALVSATLTPRLECTGNPVRLRLRGVLQNVAAGSINFNVFVDGAAADSMTVPMQINSAGAVLFGPGPGLDWDFIPAAGSHLIGWAWQAVTANATLAASAGAPLLVSFEEIVKPNASNT